MISFYFQPTLEWKIDFNSEHLRQGMIAKILAWSMILILI